MSRLLTSLAGLVFVSGCASAPAPQPAPDAADLATFELLDVSPAPGEGIQEGTVMKARLHYAVRDTEAFPGPYTVQLMFKSDGKYTRIATPEEREAGGLTSPRFDEAERDVVVEYPLDLARQSPDVVQPVTVVFLFRQALNPRDDPAVYQEEAGGWQVQGTLGKLWRTIEAPFDGG